jgi:hypothetical protein
MKQTLVSISLGRDVPVVLSKRYGLFGRCTFCKDRFYVEESMWALQLEWFEGEGGLEPDENRETESEDACLPLCPECAERPQGELTKWATDYFERCDRMSRQ